MLKNRILLGLLIPFIFYSVVSDAATINAAGCDRTSVSNAITSAQSGDTVQVPGSCSSTWSSAITVPATKELWIKGGGLGSTVISSNSFDLTANGTSQVRISDFTFNNALPNLDGAHGDRVFVIDHCRITSTSGAEWYIIGRDTSPVSAFNVPTVLIANNQLNNIRIYVWATRWDLPPNNGSSASTNFQNFLWTQQSPLGNFEHVTYVEGNTFENCNPQASYSCVDSQTGRYVARYNTITGNGYFEQHGNNGWRGSQRFELYGNNTESSSQGRFGLLQGSGVGVIFDNTPGNKDIGIGNRRSGEGACNGSNNWDQNTPGLNGYACRDQPGRSYDTTLWAAGSAYSQPLTPIYMWNNVQPGSSLMGWYYPNYGGSPDYQSVHIVANRDIYSQGSSFNGTAGVGRGTWASRPGTCTNGVGYWATDQGGNWNTSNGSSNDGALFVCTNNTWGNGTTEGAARYTPYQYPHPLLASGPDTAPPSISSPLPSGQQAYGTTSVTLQVTTNEAATCKYHTSDVAYASMGSTFGSTGGTTHQQTGFSVANGQSYTRYVRCTDGAGNANTSSTTISFSVAASAGDTTAPTTPTNLSATATSSSQINLSWTASTDAVGVAGYDIRRCSGSGCTPSTIVHSTTGTGTTWSNTGLSASTLYRYDIRAKDAVPNYSSYSSIVGATTQSSSAPPALPEGNSGIAAGYPNDTGITGNANVLFFEGFDSYTSVSQLTSSGNWSSYYQGGNLLLDTSANNFFGGTKSLRMRMPSTGSEVSNAIVKPISPSVDKLFVRAYAKYQSGYSGVNSAHNGMRITANYSGPGTIPNGSDFFYVGVEASRYQNETQPGYVNAYVYFPEQNDNYGEHWYPSGLTSNGSGPDGGFGPYFVSRTNAAPTTGEWAAWEVMVQANTPGSRDGRIAVWKDGTLIADWQNIRFRDVSTVKINEIQFENGGQGSTQINDKWYDNIVVATDYIGPMEVAGDTTVPTTTITTTDPSAITANSLTVAGTASDAVGVSGCKWRVGSAPNAADGTACTGTTSFLCSTNNYNQGANTLYVGCYDAAGNYGFDSIVVNLDSVAPIISNAAISANGTTLTLGFNEAVSIGSGGNGGLSLLCASGPRTATYVSGSGSSSLVYSIAIVRAGETCTRTYTQPGNGIEDIAGNDLLSFSSQAMTNGSTQQFTVTASAGANGSISPSSRSVNYNATTTFTVTSNSGYSASASGCGGSLVGATYTTGVITANCTVSATFTSTGDTTPPTLSAIAPASGHYTIALKPMQKAVTINEPGACWTTDSKTCTTTGCMISMGTTNNLNFTLAIDPIPGYTARSSFLCQDAAGNAAAISTTDWSVQGRTSRWRRH